MECKHDIEQERCDEDECVINHVLGGASINSEKLLGFLHIASGTQNSQIPVGGMIQNASPEFRLGLQQLTSDDLAKLPFHPWMINETKQQETARMVREEKKRFDKKVLRVR